MIVQSSNKPILVILNDDISSQVIRANLTQNGTIIKLWENDDIYSYVKDDKYILELPLEQEETASFKVGVAVFEIKWLNASGFTEFSAKKEITIENRNDREEMLDEN